MAKKPTGEKETQLRQMREAAAAKDGGGFDKTAILNEIAEFKRSKLQPIKDEIQRLQAERREIDRRLNDLNTLEAELEGRGYNPVTKAAGTRTRRTQDEKLDLARSVYNRLDKAGKHNAISAADLRDFAGGMPVSELVELWNSQADAGQKIHREGEKRATKYSLK